MTEPKGKGVLVSLLDVAKGRDAKLFEVPEHAFGWEISPDGKHIAFTFSPTNRIRVTDLQGAVEREISVKGAEGLTAVDWPTAGNGFFCGDVAPTRTRLLYVEPNGTSHVLMEQPGQEPVWAIPSPDGKHIATFKTKQSANVWMVENR
jgi:WD40 repeat protein